MNKSLKQKTEQWMSLERKTFEQRKKAEAFYDKELMKDIAEAFKENNKDVVAEPVKHMVVSVGTSYEPLALSISLLNPEHILFLYTDKSEAIIDKVADFCKLKFSQVDKARVNETESTDIYREIKNYYLKCNRPECLYVDFTGGTKAMSTAAAMAGAIINVKMIYVGSNEYLTDFRKPLPGSERLFIISNPLSVFGDIEIEKVEALFKAHNYAGACSKLENFMNNIPDPSERQEIGFIYRLGHVYEAWDALEFERAYKEIVMLNKEAERNIKGGAKSLVYNHSRSFMYQEMALSNLSRLPELMKLKKQMEILSHQNLIYPLMFTMLMSAEVREEQEKLDMATLLLYRLLEMIEQRCLSTFGLYVSQMNYDMLPALEGEDNKQTVERFKQEVFDLKVKVFGKCKSSYLPEQVSLLEGFIMLAALKHPIVHAEQETVNNLKRIRAMVILRNNSIFAHGLSAVTKQDFLKFKMFVVDLFKKLCAYESVEFDETLSNLTWVCPFEKKGE